MPSAMPISSAEHAQRDGLDQELQRDVGAARAERLPQADLARALGHRHQHDVHDADAADDQRDGGGGAEQPAQASPAPPCAPSRSRSGCRRRRCRRRPAARAGSGAAPARSPPAHPPGSMPSSNFTEIWPTWLLTSRQPIRCMRAVVIGTRMLSSWSSPVTLRPLALKMPITVNGVFLMRNVCPTDRRRRTAS